MADLWHGLSMPDRVCLRLLAGAAASAAWMTLLVASLTAPFGIVGVPLPPLLLWALGFVSWHGAAWLFLVHVALFAGVLLALLTIASKGGADA